MPLDETFTTKGKYPKCGAADPELFPPNDPRRPPEKWPRLSQQLPHERRPDMCQSCGRTAALETTELLQFLNRWVEHDDNDRMQMIVVVLCSSCERRLIEPHPRLYEKLPAFRPAPGAMPHLCTHCKYRDKLDCKHPDATINGGKGLLITVAQPIRGFWDGADPKTGKRTGGRIENWPSPATACKGFEA